MIITFKTDLDDSTVISSIGLIDQSIDKTDRLINLTLDLQYVGSIDGCGMGVFVHAMFQTRRHNAKLSIVNCSGQPRNLLVYLKLIHLIEEQPQSDPILCANN